MQSEVEVDAKAWNPNVNVHKTKVMTSHQGGSGTVITEGQTHSVQRESTLTILHVVCVA